MRLIWVILFVIFFLIFRSPQAMVKDTTIPKTKQIPPDVLAAINNNLPCDPFTKTLWVAVSAFETGFWTAPVYSKTFNLFSMHWTANDPFASGYIGADGGRVAIYSNLENSAAGMTNYFKRLNWQQLNFKSITELVNYMNSKKYFGVSVQTYIAGVTSAYRSLYGV